MSALRVGHCLLSDLAGKFEKRLDFWMSASRVGHCLLSDPAGNLKSVLTSGCLLFAFSSTSLHDGPLEEVKIKTVWSQDLGMFWSQDLELVELV